MRYLLTLLVLLGACASQPVDEAKSDAPEAAPQAAKDGPAPKPQVRYEQVHHLDGRPVHLSRFTQDRVTTTTGANGLPVTKVEPLAYMLLVVTHAECKWSKKLVDEFEAKLPELDRLGVRVVGLIKDKDGYEASEWAPLQKGGITLLEDRKGDCYDFYVKKLTPSINVIDPWGNRRLFAEGYIEPQMLVERIEKADFAPVPAGAG